MLAVRGRKNGYKNRRLKANEVQALAKDDFEGNYFVIAEVLIPATITSFPVPMSIAALNNPHKIEELNHTEFTMSHMFDEKIDFIIDRKHVINGGLSLTFLLHNPSPVHKSRFSEEDFSKWLLEPVSLTPSNDVALGCSIVFRKSSQELALDDAPLFFMGYPNNGNQDDNFIFAVHKAVF